MYLWKKNLLNNGSKSPFCTKLKNSWGKIGNEKEGSHFLVFSLMFDSREDHYKCSLKPNSYNQWNKVGKLSLDNITSGWRRGLPECFLVPTGKNLFELRKTLCRGWPRWPPMFLPSQDAPMHSLIPCQGEKLWLRVRSFTNLGHNSPVCLYP